MILAPVSSPSPLPASAPLPAEPSGGKGCQPIPQAVPALPSLTSLSELPRIVAFLPVPQAPLLPWGCRRRQRGVGRELNQRSGLYKEADLGLHPALSARALCLGRAVFPHPYIQLPGVNTQRHIFTHASRLGVLSPRASRLCHLGRVPLRGVSALHPRIPGLGGERASEMHS